MTTLPSSSHATFALAGLVACSMLVASTAQAGSVPTGVRATSARAEAEAFAALEEKRDCDAARSFLLAHSLAPDARLVVNAALALERHGADAQALELFESVRGTPAGVVADVDARIDALEGRAPGDVRGDAHDALDGAPVCVDTRGVVGVVGVVGDGGASAHEESSLLPAGIAALAGGLVVAGSTVGTFAWLEMGVIQNASSTGTAKLDALAARDPVLWAGSSIAGALVVAGAVLVPLSFIEEPQ